VGRLQDCGPLVGWVSRLAQHRLAIALLWPLAAAPDGAPHAACDSGLIGQVGGFHYKQDAGLLCRERTIRGVFLSW